MQSKNWWVTVIIVVLFIGGFLWLATFLAKPLTPKKIDNPEKLSGIATSPSPWEPELANLRARLGELGLPALTSEGTALHIHQHIDILVNGKVVTVSSHIGIGSGDSYIASIHTHDTTGIIHVESPVVQDFTLGQFFDIWGVRFTQTCLGSYCALGDRKLQVFVDGKKLETNPRELILSSHQEIVVSFGTDSELPKPLPSAYVFQGGL